MIKLSIYKFNCLEMARIHVKLHCTMRINYDTIMHIRTPVYSY